jgi:hypothetical protein
MDTTHEVHGRYEEPISTSEFHVLDILASHCGLRDLSFVIKIKHTSDLVLLMTLCGVGAWLLFENWGKDDGEECCMTCL